MSRRPRDTRVLVLGGGPAGVGAARGLARRGFTTTLVEARDTVGGNAGSFTLHGMRVDYGSHRLHPATDPEILADLRELLGDDLLERPRHGRILLGGRWIHFPLRPVDLALRAPLPFKMGVARDLAVKALPGRGTGPEEETFASILERGLGPTICRDFYFPYARKIWGLEPEEIAPAQARKRVSAGTVGKLLKRLLPGGGGGGGRSAKGTFYYPRHGYGQISEALRDAAEEAGAEILLGHRVRSVRLGGAGPPSVQVEADGETRTLEAEHLWSTIPVGPMVRMVEPAAPEDVRASAASLELRAMLLVYLVLEVDRYTEYDAHYFPGPDVPMTRLSEPKNYAARTEPVGRTVLCAEIPCSVDDPIWKADDAELGERVVDGLARAGLPPGAPLLDVAVRRLPSAYPLYRVGYEEHFDRLDGWLRGLPDLLTFGRQGLYAHDNTHHALAMARAAVACLRDDGTFDDALWIEHRAVFEGHVVED